MVRLVSAHARLARITKSAQKSQTDTARTEAALDGPNKSRILEADERTETVAGMGDTLFVKSGTIYIRSRTGSTQKAQFGNGLDKAMRSGIGLGKRLDSR